MQIALSRNKILVQTSVIMQLFKALFRVLPGLKFNPPF